MPLHRKQPAASGFTLVEMLVVISIICVLMSLLLPSLQGARVEVYRVACMAHEKEIGTSFGSYLADYNFVYPYIDPNDTPWNVPGNYSSYNAAGCNCWTNAILPYITGGRINMDWQNTAYGPPTTPVQYICPAWPYTPFAANAQNYPASTYGMNSSGSGIQGFPWSWSDGTHNPVTNFKYFILPRHESQIINPQNFCLVAEVPNNPPTSYNPAPMMPWFDPTGQSYNACSSQAFQAYSGGGYWQFPTPAYPWGMTVDIQAGGICIHHNSGSCVNPNYPTYTLLRENALRCDGTVVSIDMGTLLSWGGNTGYGIPASPNYNEANRFWLNETVSSY